MSRPAMSNLRVRWGKEKPSYTGQMWVTPSPESTTTPVSKPVDGIDSQKSILWHISSCESILEARLKRYYTSLSVTTPQDQKVKTNKGFNPLHWVLMSYPEHTEWAQPELPHKSLGTGTSQTWPLWSSPGSWWGSWAAQSAGSWRKTQMFNVIKLLQRNSCRSSLLASCDIGNCMYNICPAVFYLAFWRVDVQAVGTEGVVPQVEHVVPTAHHAVLHGVGHLQHGATLAGLITHHQVLVGGNRRSSVLVEADFKRITFFLFYINTRLEPEVF